jgi:hypothetical protein
MSEQTSSIETVKQQPDQSVNPDIGEGFPGLSSYEDDKPLHIIAVLLKEAALDSPTFRASVNHLNIQLESMDSWLDSFIKSTQRMTQEMDGKNFIITPNL